MALGHPGICPGKTIREVDLLDLLGIKGSRCHDSQPHDLISRMDSRPSPNEDPGTMNKTPRGPRVNTPVPCGLTPDLTAAARRNHLGTQERGG